MDSTIPYKPDSRATPPEIVEPFGQSGVRQYFGIVCFWVLLICFMVTCGMWYRSYQFMDRVEWRGGVEEFTASSIAGRLKLTVNLFPSESQNNDSGWIYRGRSFGTIRDGWKDSIYKIIGLEMSFKPESSNANSGFWIRIKWYFVAGVLAFLLLMQMLLKWRRTREAATA